MKHLLVVMAIVAASLSYPSVVQSEETTKGMPDDFSQFKSYGLKGQKDECLIVAKNCFGGNESVMNRIDRLNREIEKGTAVYTPEELKNLQNQLNWINSESGGYPANGY